MIYLLSTRVELSFALHKLATFSENLVEVQFEVLEHLLRYIRDNNNFGLKYHADINDTPVTDLLRQASIKTENKLIAFSDFSYQYCPDTGRSTGTYIVSFIMVRQLNMTHMFQYQLLNQVEKVSTLHHVLQECV